MDNRGIITTKKGAILIEAMIGLFIVLISVGLFYNTYLLVNKSSAKSRNIKETKKILFVLEKEIKNNISSEEINNILEEEPITFYSDTTILKILMKDNILDYINTNKGYYKEESEYLSSYNNLIINLYKQEIDGSNQIIIECKCKEGSYKKNISYEKM